MKKNSNPQFDESGNSDQQTTNWKTKVGYIGTGIVIGLVVYPFVRKTLKKIQPRLDSLIDELTGKAETLAETAADLLAKAKHSLRTEADTDHPAAPHEGHDHKHSHDHQHT